MAGKGKTEIVAEVKEFGQGLISFGGGGEEKQDWAEEKVEMKDLANLVGSSGANIPHQSILISQTSVTLHH